MTVSELIQVLKRHNPNALVVLSRDRGALACSPLSVVDSARYRAITSWQGVLSASDDLHGIDRAAAVLYPSL